MFIKNYLKNRSILIIGIILILLFIFFTFHLSFKVTSIMGDYIYIIIISIISIILLLIIDYKREKKKYKTFKFLQENLETIKDIHEFNDLDQKYLNLITEVYLKYNTKNQLLKKRQKEYQDFITSFVHDIKIPISVLKLELEQSTMNEEAKKSIFEEFQKTEEYLEKIMYFIKIDDFHQDYIPKQENLKKIVATSLKNFSKSFSYKQINLNLDIKEETILTDAKWASFIINQILSNAVKYTEPNGTITIKSEKGQNNVTLSIQNTGQGIKKSDLSRIFNRGFTGYTGHLENKSTGYGMYLSKQLADKLNHQLKVESVYKESTTFLLTFNDSNDYHIT